jgi:serine/threonine protein kinase
MEYVPTGDLNAYLREHAALPEDDARQITSQVLRGLVIMHGEGFAHRDIKPQVSKLQKKTPPSFNLVVDKTLISEIRMS